MAQRGEEGIYEWAVASETCAFHDQFEWVGDVEPGQMLVIDGEEPKTLSFASPNPRPCILECLDYASPASQVFSINTYEFRERAGVRLGKSENQKADMIVPIPRAAIPAALGFQGATGMPYREAINTVGEIGRIFIISKEKDRLEKAEKKFLLNRDLLKGKEILLIDTILVRGSTALILIPKLRAAGVSKIHLRLTAPPHPLSLLYGYGHGQTGRAIGNKSNRRTVENPFRH